MILGEVEGEGGKDKQGWHKVKSIEIFNFFILAGLGGKERLGG